MLKGGVIMDVTTAEQARIAEDAGAVAVMALERVPADIRAEGGVARMADATSVREIQESVTIPVMAKARIGHFVEAYPRGLEVDYIDESEADAGERGACRQVGLPRPVRVRLSKSRRGVAGPGRGAAMIRTKRESGTGDIVNAVVTCAVFGGIRRLQSPREESSTEAASCRQLRVRSKEENDGCRGDLHGGRHRDSGRRGAPMQLGADGVFVGSGIFKSEEPSVRAKAIVEATTHYNDPEILARVSASGEPMRPRLQRSHLKSCSRRGQARTGRASPASARSAGNSALSALGSRRRRPRGGRRG